MRSQCLAAAARVRVVALAERGVGDHQVRRRGPAYLDKLAAENDFTVDYITGTERINEESSRSTAQRQPHRLIAGLRSRRRPLRIITQGKGGWIGFHHASLLGDFGMPMDPWFSRFLGGIRFTHYHPAAKATVKSRTNQPACQGTAAVFRDR